MQREEVVL